MASYLTTIYSMTRGGALEFMQEMSVGDLSETMKDITYCIKVAPKLEELYEEVYKEEEKSRSLFTRIFRKINKEAAVAAEKKYAETSAEIEKIIDEAYSCSSMNALIETEVDFRVTGSSFLRPEMTVVRKYAVFTMNKKLLEITPLALQVAKKRQASQ